MRRILVSIVFLVALAAPAPVWAGIPTPDPMAPNCHGLAMGIGASSYRGTATFARQAQLSVIDAHFAFMDLQGCHHSG